VSPECREILSEYGKQPGFATCECASCFATRNIEKRITTRQAFHTVMGADLFEAIAADMGVHWALVAACASPKCDTTSPAYRALIALSEAGVTFSYEPPAETQQ